MTDQDLHTFLEWLRRRYLLATITEDEHGWNARTVKLSGVTNHALIEQYRKAAD